MVVGTKAILCRIGTIAYGGLYITGHVLFSLMPRHCLLGSSVHCGGAFCSACCKKRQTEASMHAPNQRPISNHKGRISCMISPGKDRGGTYHCESHSCSLQKVKLDPHVTPAKLYSPPLTRTPRLRPRGALRNLPPHPRQISMRGSRKSNLQALLLRLLRISIVRIHPSVERRSPRSPGCPPKKNIKEGALHHRAIWKWKRLLFNQQIRKTLTSTARSSSRHIT